MNFYKITSEDVIAYHEAVARKGSAYICCSDDLDRLMEFVRKGESFADACVSTGSPELRFIFEALNALGISRYFEFLSNTAITIPLPEKTLISNVIWVPWRLGEGNQAQLGRQIRCLSHELTHCLDANTSENWLVRYLTDFDERTDIEKKGFHTSMEVWFWLMGQRPRLSNHLKNIDNYYLMPSNIRVLRKALEDLIDPIVDGAVYNEATRFCIEFFEGRWGRG